MEILPIKVDDEVREHLERLQDALYTGMGGGGLVKVTMSHTFEVVNVTVAPELLADVELLEDLIGNAFNDALANIKAAHNEILQRIHQKNPANRGDMLSNMSATFMESFKENSCDCTVCDKRECCPLRPIKESLLSMADALEAE